MGRCYSGDHIAQGHIHTDIKTGNIEEPQQKYRVGTVSNRLLGAKTNFTGSRSSPSASAVCWGGGQGGGGGKFPAGT